MNDIGKLLLRLSLGGLMLTHGVPKFQKLLAGGEISFADPIGLGPTASLILVVIAEFLCSILVIIGLKTRWATIPLIITMAVAAFISHASDPIGTKEKALLFLFGFIVVALIGPGKYSVDQKIGRFQNP